MVWFNKFPSPLKELKYEIEGYAQECELDYFEVIFEVVDYTGMNEIAAYGGFPVRYPHWHFGMEYARLSKGYAYGLQKIYEMVESFLDTCLSIEDLIDPHTPFMKRREEDKRSVLREEEREERTVQRLKSKPYMDSYVNPEEYLTEQKEEIKAEKERERQFPESPEKDTLLFLREHAPLENWQSDILSMVREEAYYFAPQRQTKVMNEGWASFWHSRIMTQMALKDSELIDYAEHHSGTMGMRPGRINPYKLGLELFRDIEDRWNKGKFGPEYEACEDFVERKSWDKETGLGLEKIFEVRRIYNDIGFIDAFLTEDFCRDQKLFTYQFDNKQDHYKIESREFEKVKRQMLLGLTNFGRPSIYVVEGNYRNRGELLLSHQYDGVGLDMGYAKDTLRNVRKIWGRPVHLSTKEDEKETLLTCEEEGDEVKTERTK